MTPTGMLSKNDVIVDPEGRQWLVLERHGRDILYSVKIVPANAPNTRPRWLLTPAWWLRHGWSLVTSNTEEISNGKR